VVIATPLAVYRPKCAFWRIFYVICMFVRLRLDLNPASFKYLEVNARNNHCNPRHLRCYNMDGRYCLTFVHVTLRFVYGALCSAVHCGMGVACKCTAFCGVWHDILIHAGIV
jgi:hypothetical protein